jgi:hypothetical protein
MKFNDLDADGVKDAGEPGLSGWTIYVDYDDDGVLDAGEPSDVTDGSGNYTITGINPGTYKVREVGQTDWVCSFPSPCYHNETFQSGDALTGNDFGNWLIPECEPGDRLTSVTLKVIAPSTTPLRIDVTDDHGKLENASILQSIDPANLGTEFTVVPSPGPFFDSQNLRFRLGPVGGPTEASKNLKVHLSCSDDPAIGDTHFGDDTGFSVTLEKTFFITTQF